MTDQCPHREEEFRQHVIAERVRRCEKWGAQSHSAAVWLAILGEEFGEACQAALELRFDVRPILPLLRELVQVAAVAEAAFVDLSQKTQEEASHDGA